MAIKNPVIYKIPDNERLNAVIKSPDPTFNIRENRPEEIRISVYDTFDWRLFKNKYALLLFNKKLSFSPLFSQDPIFTRKIDEHKRILPPFPVNTRFNTIVSIIKVRALLCQATVRATKRHFIIRKTGEPGHIEMSILLFFPVDGVSPQTPPPIFLVFYHQYPGQEHYAPFIDSIKKICTSRGVKQDLFYHILSYQHIKPGNYSGKMHISLLPHMSTETACRIILSSLFHIINRNEQGVKEHIDPEFLHDFRVSIRRTRSLCSQVKKVFPGEQIKSFRDFFKYYGKLTNKPRDIDVYLLKMEEFRNILPRNIKKGLLPLETYLKSEQLSLYRDLKKEMESTHYKEMTHNWQMFLHTPVKPENKPSKADTPVLKTARRVIYSQYEAVITSGIHIKDETTPPALHALRISCKKLRYLLEFFISLFPPLIMNKIITGLKGLQDNLGLFQDLQIQQEMLPSLLKEVTDKNMAIEETGKAVTYLVEHFKKEEIQLRREFSARFRKFNSNENRSYFQFLCNKHTSPGKAGHSTIDVDNSINE